MNTFKKLVLTTVGSLLILASCEPVLASPESELKACAMTTVLANDPNVGMVRVVNEAEKFCDGQIMDFISSLNLKGGQGNKRYIAALVVGDSYRELLYTVIKNQQREGI